MDEARKIRTYLDDVPEDVKAQLSRAWGERKRETYHAADKHGIKIEEGTSFNRVVTFELERGLYHITSDIVSTKDISPESSDVGVLTTEVIKKMVKREEERECTPLFASNVCDWDSGYAKEVGANTRLRNSIINTCIKNDIVLTGGETANLGDQVRKKGMSWQFTLLSRYNGSSGGLLEHAYNDMDSLLQDTFSCIADRNNYEIVYGNGMPLLHVKKKSKFVMTADGTGSKSIVCNQIDKRTDIKCTLEMCGGDAVRDGAFPILSSIGIHAEKPNIRDQIVYYMKKSGKEYSIPLVGCTFHNSDDVSTYIMNGVMLSEVRKKMAHVGKVIYPGLILVLLYEEQRSNGITTQRKILSETFGEEWYKIKVSDAFNYLNGKLQGKYSSLAPHDGNRTLGELVAQPSTPYFRIDSMMPEELLDKIKFRINISSGGLIGKTRRLLEPLGLGADYSDVFEAPDLISLLQMASLVEESKGIVSDKVAYFTWGCGNGAVIGTTDPIPIIDYYKTNGIKAKIGGIVKQQPQIKITSKCLESTLQNESYTVSHRYTEEPLG